ncbi:unnamed protein product [Owenia fusiformis]|uniref:Protein-PII uridylyltransferase N-terminal domain-containing protein n=1 Tax=Owenia fusiformis TaxID=6347 RepID=A0A8S4NDH8_OWEFU|nr:unnamed protein product [Owenia fusiformis]
MDNLDAVAKSISISKVLDESNAPDVSKFPNGASTPVNSSPTDSKPGIDTKERTFGSVGKDVTGALPNHACIEKETMYSTEKGAGDAATGKNTSSNETRQDKKEFKEYSIPKVAGETKDVLTQTEKHIQKFEEGLTKSEEEEARTKVPILTRHNIFDVAGVSEVTGFLEKLRDDKDARREFEDERRKKERLRWKRENEIRAEEDRERAKQNNDEVASSCFRKNRDVNKLDINSIDKKREKENERRKEEDERISVEDKDRKEKEDKMWLEFDNLLKKIPTMGIQNLENKEKECVKELKKIAMINKQHKDHKKKTGFDEWMKHIETHVKKLIEIGTIHRKIGEIKENQLDIVKAIAIYECAIVHCQESYNCSKAETPERNKVKEGREEIQKIERRKEEEEEEKDRISLLCKTKEEKRLALQSFFRQCTSTGEQLPDDQVKKMLKKYDDDEHINKKELQRIRTRLKEKIKAIDKDPNCDCYEDNIKRETRLKREKARIDKNGEIFKWIQREMKGFVTKMIAQCRKIHNFKKEDFAFIAFGSLSRMETTPYSDVEFAVVQNSDDEKMDPTYKKELDNIIMTLHLKMLSFGETVLPAMDINSLSESDANDKTKDWYFDLRKYVKTKQGISFDGMMPRANKTPYFTYRAQPENIEFSLTNTKAAFINFFEKIETEETLDKLLFLFKGDFTTLYGDESIEKEMKERFKESPKRDQVLRMIERELRKDFVKHSCIKKIYDAKYDREIIAKESIHVKKELYRLPSVVINNLLHLLKSPTTCVWKIEELSRIKKESIHNLKMTLSTAAEIRLRCYAESDGQVDEEKGQLLPDILVENEEKETFCKKLILRYFWTAIPLVRVIEEAESSRIEKEQSKNANLDGKKTDLEDGNGHNKTSKCVNEVIEKVGNEEQELRKTGQIEHIIESLETASLYDDSDLNKALAFLLMNDNDNAKKYLEKANEKYKNIGNISPTQYILYILCNTYIKDTKISDKFFDSLGGKGEGGKGEGKSKSMDTAGMNARGNALIQKERYEEAEKVLEESVDKSSKDEKITALILLKTAYEEGGNVKNLKALRDEHPEIEEIQHLREKLKKSEELENNVIVQAEKRERENLELRNEISQLRIRAEKSESENQNFQDEINRLRNMVREQAVDIDKQKAIEDNRLRLYGDIEKLEKTAAQTDPTKYNAIKEYMKQISRQYSESVEETKEALKDAIRLN